MALVFNTPKSALNTTSKDIQNLSSDCPPCPEVNLTTADVEYTENGEYTVTPEEGYDGLTKVDITVNIPSDVKNQDKFVTPTTSSQTITADSGYSGLGTVSVSAVTSSIDANIAAGNIKKDVSILGVTGSYDPQPDLETKTVTYTTNDTYTITPTAGKDGMSSVEVTVNVSGSNCPDWSSIGWDCNDVTASGLAADVAYTAQKKAEYEAGTIANFKDDKQLVFAPKVTPKSNSMLFFEYCSELRYCTNLNVENNTDLLSWFLGATKLNKVNIINSARITSTNQLFDGCYKLNEVGIDDTSSVTDMGAMFRNCTSLLQAPFMNTSNVTSMNNMFLCDTTSSNGTMQLTTIPQYDTSNVSNMSRMFGSSSTDTKWTTIPQLNTTKVELIREMFKRATALTTLGGFTNLGKAFVGASANQHLLDLSSSTVLTKESIMNVINNLAAPDDTTCTDATLKLSATSYALLTAEDIAIATAKNWTVTSA